MDNRAIAQRLLDYADSLRDRKGNLYRVRAYRRAADTVLTLLQPVEEIVHETGKRGLSALPGIGRHLAFTIDHLVRTGEFRTMSEKNAPQPDSSFPASGLRETRSRGPRTSPANVRTSA